MSVISMWRSDVYHLLTMRHVFIEVEIKMRTLLYFLKLAYVKQSRAPFEEHVPCAQRY